MTGGKRLQKPRERGLYDWMQPLLCAIVAAVLFCMFFVRVVRVDGEFMRETLQDGDLLAVVNGWLCPEYTHRDIVIIREKTFRDGSPIVKRVIATEGETVDIDFTTGEVRVNGTVLEEPYIRELTMTPEGMQFPVTVPENSLFVMGDNRNDSGDSRDPELGFVDTRSVIGKAVFLLFPSGAEGTDRLSRFQILA